MDFQGYKVNISESDSIIQATAIGDNCTIDIMGKINKRDVLNAIKNIKAS